MDFETFEFVFLIFWAVDHGGQDPKYDDNDNDADDYDHDDHDYGNDHGTYTDDDDDHVRGEGLHCRW